MTARKVVANTLVWLREQSYERGTEFAVVPADKLNPKATAPVEVDEGTADLWVRHKTAADATTTPPAPKTEK